MYLVHLAIGEACASETPEIVDSVPTVVADKKRIVHGYAAAEAYYSANCSGDLRTNVPSVDQGVVSVQRVEVEAGKNLDLLPAAVDQGMCSVERLGDIERPL